MDIIYYILSGFIIIFIIQWKALIELRNNNKDLKTDLREKDAEKKSLADEVSNLKLKIIQLSRYQTCIDAEATAENMIRRAEDESSQKIRSAELQATTIISNAKAEISDMKGKTHINLEKSEIALNDAVTKAKTIIDDAEIRAREIAGEAYDLSKNIAVYEKALTSIKNIVKGYGFDYIKPLDSILDNLATEYGFTEAGKELVQARDLTKRLVSNGLAATCGYVEQNRRDTAIAFILDAFNGKVDSILSLIKKDNYGTLEQKIKDAYAVVNLLARPFKNAHIQPEYLEARLAELKWGVAVIAIKAKEKEEQRAIKERIREEERARREYEKAIRDAEKQESTIRKAIEKATIQLSKANEEQRLKFEAQLNELQAQLLEAEARNQRALSMAQQTRSGHVYIISNIGSFGENVYKIGMTRRLEPLDRVRELGDASVPFPFDVHAMIFSEDAPTLETELHKLYASNQINKVNPRKEFFRLSISEIKSYLEKKNIQTQWTLIAEAAQYRETLALEESFKKNDGLKEDWIRKQGEDITNMVLEDEAIE